jgi:alkanesulfonate monooxygenase SsuD/methylene tetrahydromethanopterin reductase-like flavin-dependent oxidoreductase (luciferase family)
VAEKRDQWREAVEQIANMMAMDPYPGYEGKYFSMPCRNVVPKPVQRPHPPLWVACSNRETIKLAAKLGIGALTFSFVDPKEAKQWVDDYYRILKTECTPIGHAVNANIAMVTGFSCHQDEQEAIRRGLDGFNFFGYALGHHYIFGDHKPGRTNIWERFEKARGALPATGANRGIGTPAQLRAHLRGFADAGVDQVTFIQQGGKNRHEHICESLDVFARQVMAEFHDGDAERERRKQSELAPYIEQALARKQRMRELRDEEIPVLHALGRQIVEQQPPDAARAGGSISVPLEDPVAKA